MERAISYADAWNAGRFAVPLGLEWDGFIAEHLEFTGLNDAHDDQVDASAHGWNLGWRDAPSHAIGGVFLGPSASVFDW
jgi:phage terminase large subunit-like protein